MKEETYLKIMKWFSIALYLYLIKVSVHLCYLFHVDGQYGIATMWAVIAGALLGILAWTIRTKNTMIK